MDIRKVVKDYLLSQAIQFSETNMKIMDIFSILHFLNMGMRQLVWESKVSKEQFS